MKTPILAKCAIAAAAALITLTPALAGDSPMAKPSHVEQGARDNDDGLRHPHVQPQPDRQYERMKRHIRVWKDQHRPFARWW